MPFSITQTQGKLVLELEGSVTIRDAQDLAGKLNEWPDDWPSLTVATRALEDTDTCILQLLCSLRKTVPSVSFDHPSEAFTAASDRCGLRRQLFGAREDV